MSGMTEMKAYEEQVNLTLLNNIIAFVADTAKADHEQKRKLAQRCIFLEYNVRGDAFQQKYGFLYLGELLERYEDRFGMSAQDRRAIALALGYTRDIATNEMFVGNQRNVFLQELCRYADNDIYLAGALYLLNEGQSGEKIWLDQLNELQYERTEELIFIMSLFPDFEETFLRFKPQLLHLLGSGRTMAVQGNTQILAWIIARILPVVKTMRGKDMALIRALCALPVSFVKEESKYHSTLQEHGYSPFEIVYANIMVARSQMVAGSLRSDSIVTEKIVINLFWRALGQADALDQDTYARLSELLIQYAEFPIRCYGHSELLDALKEGPHIQNAETFIWFSERAPLSHPAFAAFDIMDDKWDPVAKGLPAEKYLSLFEAGLNRSMGKEGIQTRIDRYDALTGESYTGIYQTTSKGRCFSLLIETEVIDLWAAFRASIDKTGVIHRPEMLGYIKSYLREIRTLQAFLFYQKFLPQYGFDGYQKYLKPQHNDFSEGLMKSGDNRDKAASIHVERDYLKDDEAGSVTLLQWLEEYLFKYRPTVYLSFICALLKKESVAGLFPQAELRPLFDMVIDHPELDYYERVKLKQRYWTAEELEAEQSARAAAALAEEQKKMLELAQDIQEQYAQKADGTLTTLCKFLNAYYKTSEERSIAADLVREKLPQLLAEKNFTLESVEAGQLLRICAELVRLQSLRFTEAQDYISKVKEAAANDAGNDSND